MPRAVVRSGVTGGGSPTVEIDYEVLGDPAQPALVLLAGLGSSLAAWDDELCAALAAGGFFVVRLDNRDAGRSTKLPGGVHYTLSDMAADVIGVLDDLSVPAAHVVGVSMGGMIAQTLAIEHPDRVITLTSIMSNTGEGDVATADAATRAVLGRLPPTTQEAAVTQHLETFRVIGGPHFDEDHQRARAEREWERSQGTANSRNQLRAITESGSRAAGLAALACPTLVLHGAVDPLVPVAGGRRTAELVPGARYVEYEEMGHLIPPRYRAEIAAAIVDHARQSVGS
jgi:pimeloyl-ACP methyl ester carboxylesterase